MINKDTNMDEFAYGYIDKKQDEDPFGNDVNVAKVNHQEQQAKEFGAHVSAAALNQLGIVPQHSARVTIEPEPISKKMPRHLAKPDQFKNR